MLSVSEGLFLKIFAKCLICFSRGGVVVVVGVVTSEDTQVR